MTKHKTDVADSAQADARKILFIRAGRGNSGGTTALNASIELALMEGRNPVILDAARNPSLSAFYPGAAVRPDSHAISDVKEAITTRVLDAMLEQERPGVIDLGGGQDDTLIEYMLDLDLVAFGASVGIRPVFVVTFGPQMDDFEHAVEIKRRGVFDGAGVLLIQNEGVLRRGQEPRKVFGAIQGSAEFIRWIDEGAQPLYLPTLPFIDDVRRLGLTLRDASANKPNPDGKSLGITKAWTTKNWLNGFRKEFEINDCAEWRI
jgi:hypothetical protein